MLDEIIALLSDQNGSLEGALLKTKVLLHQIGHKDLVPWVNNELGGYPDDAKVPDYRYVSAIVRGSVLVGFYQHPDTLLPINHLKPEMRGKLTKRRMSNSIGNLEEIIRKYRQEKLGIITYLAPELYGSFKKGLTKEAEILSAWCAINMADVEAIVVQVRSRLLDFCLELQGVVGAQSDPKQLQKMADEANAGKMFQTIIYGGTNIFGSQHVQVHNQQGDIEGLLKEVAKLGYQQKDLDELRQAVIEDKAEGRTPDIAEGKTGNWVTGALKKAGKGIANTGIDVAARVIMEAMKHYIGG